MTILLGEGILSTRLYRKSYLDRIDYSWIIKIFSSVDFTTVHANLIKQTTSSIELDVLKRRIIVVIRKDSRCLLLHQLEQHRRILLSKETYRTLAQPADPCGNHFGDMIWKIPNPTLSFTWFSKRATNYKTVVRKMTYEDKASYGSVPLCNLGDKEVFSSLGSWAPSIRASEIVTLSICSNESNTLHHTAAICNTLQLQMAFMSRELAAVCNALQHTATHCNTLQRTATHCNLRWHSCRGSLQQCGQAWYASRRTRMRLPLPMMQLFAIWRGSDFWACRVGARPLRCHGLLLGLTCRTYCCIHKWKKGGKAKT